MSFARISHVQIGAAHDGDAELIVTMRHENGGKSLVSLDEYAARALLKSCGTAAPDDLVGASWEKVRDALVASSNRFSSPQDSDS